MSQPWIKFYPRDWRGDQALRLVSLTARGLWIEMLCIMHEASPYGHFLVGGQPVSDDALARVVGSSVEEVQALLVELRTAGVFRHTRAGVVYSKRMTDDHKRSVDGRKAKEAALAAAAAEAQGDDNKPKNPPPSRPPKRPPTTQKVEAIVKVEGQQGPSTLYEPKNLFLGPSEVRSAFEALCGPDWCGSYIDPCDWQDVPERALIPANAFAGRKIIQNARPVLSALGITILERRATA